MKKLTPRERLERAYFHQEMDRPGVYIRRGWPKDDPTYAPLIKLVDEKTDLKFGWSLKSPSAGIRTETRTEPVSEDFQRIVTTMHTPKGPLTASRFVSLKGRPGLSETYFIKDERDIERYLSLPGPLVGGETDSFFKLKQEVGDRGIVEASIGSNPAGHAAAIFGSEAFAILSVTHRDLVHQVLERETQILLGRLKHQLAAGIGPFFNMAGQEYVAPPLHSPRDFRDFNVAYDKRLTDLVHEAGGRVHVHCHGSVRRLLDLFVEMGVDVLHPIEPPPMGDCPAKAAKQALRGKICIEGNIQIGDMYEASVENIEAQTRALIADAFDDRRDLIVCPTASPYIRDAGGQCFPRFERMVEIVLAAGA